jgi:hypothetical protein
MNATQQTASIEAEKPKVLRPVAETLSAVALEVNELAHLSDRLQAMISGALINDGATNDDHLREFQAIDLLVQRLHGVSTFVTALANATPGEWKVDAAGATADVVLSALAQRLSGRPHAAEPAIKAEDAGSMDFFG